MILDKFRRKKDDMSIPEPFIEPQPELPDDLERFRMRVPEVRPAEPRQDPRSDYPVPEVPYGKSVEDLVAEKTQGNKIDLILQKLETVDARLRLIEEKMRKY